MQRYVPCFLSVVLLSGCVLTQGDGLLSKSAKPVFASVRNRTRRNASDAAGDPAIWVHPTDKSRNLIIGTDKKNGLDVYDLASKRVQTLQDGRMNNVDLRYGFCTRRHISCHRRGDESDGSNGGAVCG